MFLRLGWSNEYDGASSATPVTSEAVRQIMSGESAPSKELAAAMAAAAAFSVTSGHDLRRDTQRMPR